MLLIHEISDVDIYASIDVYFKLNIALLVACCLLQAVSEMCFLIVTCYCILSYFLLQIDYFKTIGMWYLPNATFINNMNPRLRQKNDNICAKATSMMSWLDAIGAKDYSDSLLSKCCQTASYFHNKPKQMATKRYNCVILFTVLYNYVTVMRASPCQLCRVITPCYDAPRKKMDGHTLNDSYDLQRQQ